MCGIAGFVSLDGRKNAGEMLAQGLARLEYRGYDSCGIAVAENNTLTIRKGVGMVGAVTKREGFNQEKGTAGIAHTRWATHGGVTRENAHPHASCNGEIAIVHNGIIENYEELRGELEKRGHAFSSETDSEIIAHLIEEAYAGDLAKALRMAAARLNGSYAIAAVSKTGELALCRKDSPLVIGVADDAYYAGSDSMPFIGLTDRIIIMNDGTTASIGSKGIEMVETNSGKPVALEETKAEWQAEAAELGKHAHFMHKEIHETPRTMPKALEQDEAEFKAFVNDVKAAKRIIIAACGTSYHAGMMLRNALLEVAGIRSEIAIASEYAYIASRETKDTLIIAITQSGETADIMSVIKAAKPTGARIRSILNVKNSTIDRASDGRLYFNCGPEIGVAATKSFLAPVAIGFMLAHAAAGKEAQGRENILEFARLAENAINDTEEQCKNLGARIARKHSAYFLGRHYNHPAALEGALKLKETSYVHAEGLPSGELKHGPIALLEKDMPVIIANPSDHTLAETRASAEETKARGAWNIGIVNEGAGCYHDALIVPKCDPLLAPAMCAIPMQLLAYYTATAKGLNPDKPRNLAKSVTVK